MRLPFLPPPGPLDLEHIRVHELVRDYPELIPFLRDAGPRLPSEGALPLPRSFLKVRGEDLLSLVAWRRTGTGLRGGE